MKNKKNILVLIILITLFSCGQTSNTHKIDKTNNNTKIKVVTETENIKPTEIKKELTEADKKKQIQNEKRIDSLRLDFALKNAFKIAKTNFELKKFSKEYEIQPDDSSYNVKIEILIGNLFENNQKYFLLRRHIPLATYIDLYLITGDKAKKLVEREQGGMTYIKDTIFDVNGDNYKDFIVNWYPSSGCCRRDIYNVYLYIPNKKTFSNDYEFINPTFSAKEKIIRGVGYGHPGEVELYKYKWNGFRVDTIEFIYPNVKTKGEFIKTKTKRYSSNSNEGEILKSLPIEYQNINSIDWFREY